MKIPGADRAVVEDEDPRLPAVAGAPGRRAQSAVLKSLGFLRNDWEAVQQMIAGMATSEARSNRHPCGGVDCSERRGLSAFVTVYPGEIR
jgi:hypothetical protein